MGWNWSDVESQTEAKVGPEMRFVRSSSRFCESKACEMTDFIQQQLYFREKPCKVRNDLVDMLFTQLKPLFEQPKRDNNLNCWSGMWSREMVSAKELWIPLT